jgi:hypothetical protein
VCLGARGEGSDHLLAMLLAAMELVLGLGMAGEYEFGTLHKRHVGAV